MMNRSSCRSSAVSRRTTRLAVVGLLSVLAASAARAGECRAESFGAGVNLDAPTAIADILDRPEEFVGQSVLVEAEIADVCQMAGCWLELRAADGARTLKVKVDDGVMVFPKDARGRRARAQGTVERLELDREGYIIHLEHEAHEQGRDFDESTVPADGPWYVYRIAGTGAEICL